MKVAIISLASVSYYDDYGESNYQFVANHITDWKEVTTEEYNMLIQGVLLRNSRSTDFKWNVIKQVNSDEIFGLIDEWKEFSKDAIRKEEERKAKEKERLEIEKQKRDLKKLQKQKLNEEKQKQMYEILKKKFEN